MMVIQPYPVPSLIAYIVIILSSSCGLKRIKIRQNRPKNSPQKVGSGTAR